MDNITATGNIHALANAVQAANIKVPASVETARATIKAAEALVEQINNQARPDTEQLTAQNIAATHEAIIAYGHRDEALTVARELLAAAHGRETHAWQLAVPELKTAFAKPFNTAVADLTTALGALGHKLDELTARKAGLGEAYDAAVAAAARISGMANARRIVFGDEYKNGNSGLDQHTAPLIQFPNRNLATKWATRFQMHPPFSLAELSELIREGVTIEWPLSPPVKWEAMPKG